MMSDAGTRTVPEDELVQNEIGTSQSDMPRETQPYASNGTTSNNSTSTTSS